MFVAVQCTTIIDSFGPLPCIPYIILVQEGLCPVPEGHLLSLNLLNAFTY